VRSFFRRQRAIEGHAAENWLLHTEQNRTGGFGFLATPDVVSDMFTRTRRKRTRQSNRRIAHAPRVKKQGGLATGAPFLLSSSPLVFRVCARVVCRRSMSSGSPAPSVAPSVAPSSSIAPSVETLKSASTRKKRTIVVVRRPRGHRIPDSSDDDDGAAPALPKKKTLLVARRPRASEGRLFEHEAAPLDENLAGAAVEGRDGWEWGRGAQHGGENHNFSSSAAAKLEWLPDGHVLDKSVLGTAAAFEEVCTTKRSNPYWHMCFIFAGALFTSNEIWCNEVSSSCVVRDSRGTIMGHSSTSGTIYA